MDYRDTINLPFTELAMKAGLAKKEPEKLKQMLSDFIKIRGGKFSNIKDLKLE